MQSQKITLTNDLFLGKGAHKACYQHPTDNNLCIKILFQTPDIDLEKELSYRAILKKRNKTSLLLPQYFGTINTNLGEGHVFECCRDYDGKVSQSIYDFIKGAPLTDKHLENIVEYILSFKTMYLTENIVTSDTDPRNFMIKRISDTKYTFKIIDNIGSPVKIPLAYYFDFFAKKRAKKYWGRFIIKLIRFFPEIFTEDVINKIK